MIDSKDELVYVRLRMYILLRVADGQTFSLTTQILYLVNLIHHSVASQPIPLVLHRKTKHLRVLQLNFKVRQSFLN